MSARSSAPRRSRGWAPRRSRGWLPRWWGRFRREQAPKGTPAVGDAQDAASGIDSDDPTSLLAQTLGCGLSAGEYITDGSSLFRVEHAHLDRGSGTLFVELENCVTLELSVWSADALAARPVRCVTPVGASQFSDAAFA